MKNIFTLWLLFISLSFAAERPNIIWITSEDNAASWLGCYGNKEAQTPHLDKLATEGIRFTRAYANAPVCAVARSTILNGMHAVSQGTHHMRSRYPIPANITPYVTAMRAAGYYCTNQSKTDYNFRGDDNALWDASSGKAGYRNRPAGKPFLAVINLFETHESSLFPDKIAASRKNGAIPAKPRVDPASLTLPPYLPDLPEIRSDMAIYHDNVTAMDREVGRILDQLDRDGLSDNTIVFYYSDHGGILPRGKRYLEDSGTRVPLIIRIPGKWRKLSPFASGMAVDELVSFVDFAPTLLSLAGIETIPPTMQGRPFLGPLRREAPADDMIFLSADRFDEIPGMRRGITDGRWKYIRCFTPHMPGAPYSTYQFGQAGWTAWRKAFKAGSIEPQFRALWQTPQPMERLYDLTTDPHEARDLTNDPAHTARLQSMRARLRGEMILHRDAGLIPEVMYDSLVRTKPIADHVAELKASLPDLVDLALLAGVAQPSDLDNLRKQLAAPDPLRRYWAAHAVASSPGIVASLLPEMTTLVKDSEAAIRLVAVGALHATDASGQSKKQMIKELESSKSEALTLAILSGLARMDSLDLIPDSWIEEKLHTASAMDPYPKRIAQQLRRERSRGEK
jgi:N-sulfoglucosamine sulfohydrolase